jgi:triacylglycerol esterase/lipase EstA (alpha/beta hydrolase family)
MSIKHVLLALLLLVPATAARAVCHDTVVMVHGNTGSPGDFVNTYNLLRQNGWTDAQIVRPGATLKTAPPATTTTAAKRRR